MVSHTSKYKVYIIITFSVSEAMSVIRLSMTLPLAVAIITSLCESEREGEMGKERWREKEKE